MGTNTKFNVSVLALIMHGKQIMDEVGKKININTFDDHCISWANNFVTAIAYTVFTVAIDDMYGSWQSMITTISATSAVAVNSNGILNAITGWHAFPTITVNNANITTNSVDTFWKSGLLVGLDSDAAASITCFMNFFVEMWTCEPVKMAGLGGKVITITQQGIRLLPMKARCGKIVLVPDICYYSPECKTNVCSATALSANGYDLAMGYARRHSVASTTNSPHALLTPNNFVIWAGITGAGSEKGSGVFDEPGGRPLLPVSPQRVEILQHDA